MIRRHQLDSEDVSEAQDARPSSKDTRYPSSGVRLIFSDPKLFSLDNPERFSLIVSTSFLLCEKHIPKESSEVWSSILIQSKEILSLPKFSFNFSLVHPICPECHHFQKKLPATQRSDLSMKASWALTSDVRIVGISRYRGMLL